MGPRGLLCLILLCNTANAGMDFTWGNKAMTSEEYYKDYKIPWFYNRESAVIWAHKHKYSEPLRRLLRRRMIELMREAQKTSGTLEPTMLKKTAYFMSEWDDVRAALEVINSYKKNGASVYAGSVPVEGYNGTTK